MQDAKPKQKILEVFEKGLGGLDPMLRPDQVAQLIRKLAPSLSKDTDERINELVRSTCILNSNGSVTCGNLVEWLFCDSPIRNNTKIHHHWKLPPRLHDDISGDRLVQTSFALQLQEFASAHPYLTSSDSSHPHPLSYWYTRCQECFEARKFSEAQEHLRRVQAGVETDRRQIHEAFRRFDIDSSGHLDLQELQYMCAYLGWAAEQTDFMDLDRDGRITLPDFQLFVGRMGGVQKLFEQRRLRIGTSRKDVCDQLGLSVGARVRSHFYAHGQKSRSWREAQVLKVRVERHYGKTSVGPVTYGVLLEFGFGKSKRWGKWRATQVVPPAWVLSSVDDAETAIACREIGFLDEDQSFWSLLVPDSELQALQRLTSCQREALRKTRDHATKSHEEALPKVRERLKKFGWGERELNAVLSWVQDLATLCVHVHLDKMGKFMETDEFYRSQFETKTSCGAGSGDTENRTRKGWETELFGGAYDAAKNFERCKYGALNALNDFRGVVRARGYGDSYLVLKDCRLRCTFASTDSGGIRGKRLGVLDKYAHVLQEYTDDEFSRLVRVAVAASAPEGHDTALFFAELLRGPTYDSAKDWVTIGFPSICLEKGCYYFEVNVEKSSASVQVGLLSSDFLRTPHSPSNEGVGDDCHGWAVDGANAGRWHNGSLLPWGQAWKLQKDRTLSEDVVVGVAVDLNNRELHFSTNGVWDMNEDGKWLRPAFDSECLPENMSLYPAISFKGRATFNFGPAFKHAAPPGGKFSKWLGTPETLVRVDKPHIGDESAMRIYKEIQIHGEVNLKRNVQRLVADRKYIDMPKSQRSLGVRISGAGLCDGTYKRVGVHNRQPWYRHSSGGPCIFFDSSSQSWVLSSDGSFDRKPSNFTARVADEDVSSGPPRVGWGVPAHMKGSVPELAFRESLKSRGYEDTEPLISALSMKTEDGTLLVCKERDDVSLSTELPKYKCANRDAQQEHLTCEGEWQRGGAGAVITIGGGIVRWSPGGRTDPVTILSDTSCELTMSGKVYTAKLELEGKQLSWDDGDIWMRVARVEADSATPVWEAAIDFARKQVLAESGLSEALTVATAHPYEAKTTEWRQEYSLKSSSGLVVLFSSKSRTYDSCAEWKIFSGGLRRAAAGAGARVEVTAPGGSDKVWGTVVERKSIEDVWKIRLDRRSAVPPAVDESAWPAVSNLVEARRDDSADKWEVATVVEVRDGKVVVAWCPTSSEEAQWACSRCSFLNHRSAAICEMCGFPQAESKGLEEAKETCEKDLADVRALAVKEASSLVSIRPCDFHQLDTWLTCGAKHLARNKGKFYYELRLDEFFLNPQIGWLLEDFIDMPFNKDATEGEGDDLPGVGDDEFGWSCDGVRNQKWHAGSSAATWPRNWLPQDIIGLALDIAGGTMQFSLNGEWVENASFEGVTFSGNIYPAVSIAGLFTMHIPKATWQFSPPDSEYEAWSETGVFSRPEYVKPKTTSSMEQASRELDDLPRYAAVAGEADCFAVCPETPPFSVSVRYEGKASAPDEQGYYPDLLVGDELASLCLDRSTPLMPIVVQKFRSVGPAQKQGVHEGWRLDLSSTLAGPSRDAVATLFQGMPGIETADNLQSLASLMDALFGDIDETLRRLNDGVGKLSEVTLTFSSGCTATPVTLLPEAFVTYNDNQKVGEEIRELIAGDDKAHAQLQVAGFLAEIGPAQTAGVRHGWLLDVRATIARNREAFHAGAETTLMNAPGDLLSMSGITVVFVHPCPSPVELFSGSGTEAWTRVEVPGDTATFSFHTDGDGGDSPDMRWGVHCMLMPKELELGQEEFDGIVSKIMDLELKGRGVKGEPEVQRDSWDENRLRALCARHGWDFEWMTEDGEGRRRARERLRLVDIPMRPSAPDPSLPDGSKGVGAA